VLELQENNIDIKILIGRSQSYFNLHSCTDEAEADARMVGYSVSRHCSSLFVILLLSNHSHTRTLPFVYQVLELESSNMDAHEILGKCAVKRRDYSSAITW